MADLGQHKPMYLIVLTYFGKTSAEDVTQRISAYFGRLIPT
jgi:hypothetical protein